MYSDGRADRSEELEKISTVFRVEYTPIGDDYYPRKQVVARYELIEVVEGELPRKNDGELAQKIVARIAKKFL